LKGVKINDQIALAKGDGEIIGWRDEEMIIGGWKVKVYLIRSL
jgi:hypothetical protein